MLLLLLNGLQWRPICFAHEQQVTIWQKERERETVRGELPWNADWELEMTEECWMAGETGRDEGTEWGREEDGCWPGPVSNGWLTWAALSEGEDGGRGGEGNEEKASTGPCTKSLNSSSSSGKAGGREWEVTEEWDGDESAKTKQESETDTTTHIVSYDHTETDWKKKRERVSQTTTGECWISIRADTMKKKCLKEI